MSLFTTGIVQEFLTTHQGIPYTLIFVLSGTGINTFEVPENVYQMTVGCWGGGGAGGGIVFGNAGAGGGGGGGYAESTIVTNPGTIYTYNVGSGGTGTGLVVTPTSGGTSYFGLSGCNAYNATIRACGGYAWYQSSGTEGWGGGYNSLYPNVGTIKYIGGNGASPASVPTRTGGGGSGAGSLGNGNAGSQGNGSGGYASGGTGVINLGGTGGLGYPLDPVLPNGKTVGSGFSGTNYSSGGGGGGACVSGTHNVDGGNGCQGLIIIACLT